MIRVDSVGEFTEVSPRRTATSTKALHQGNRFTFVGPAISPNALGHPAFPQRPLLSDWTPVLPAGEPFLPGGTGGSHGTGFFYRARVAATTPYVLVCLFRTPTVGKENTHSPLLRWGKEEEGLGQLPSAAAACWLSALGGGRGAPGHSGLPVLRVSWEG